MSMGAIYAKQFFQDLNWKQLAISALIALIFFWIGCFLIFYIKEISFPYWFNNILDEKSDNFQQIAQNYFDSYYWTIAYILVFLPAQIIAAYYLAKKSPNTELTNGLALGVICMVFVYWFDPIFSFLGILFSLATSYKVKQESKKIKENS